MIRKILVGGAAVVALFATFVATRPSACHIERSITIAAPPEAAFAQVNDFHAWQAWSPYEKLDPQMKRAFGGAASGTGATYAWTSDSPKAGEGRMTLERSEPASRAVIGLELIKPFAATNTVTFTFVPAAGGTKVTWAMDGTNDFFTKAIHLVVDVDKLVGADFERGLASLKTVAESASNGGVAATNGGK
jgi:hypothetical protein